MWRSDSCYSSYGVDGSTCSYFIYLSEVTATFLLFFPRPEDGGREGGQKGQGAETSLESLFRRRLLLRKTTSSFRGKLTQSNFPAKTPPFLDRILHKKGGRERKITVTQTTRATGEQQQVPQVVVGGGGVGGKKKKTQNNSDPEAERPATREPCAKNKLIRVAECISYLMRANYGESRWLVCVCVCWGCMEMIQWVGGGGGGGVVRATSPQPPSQKTWNYFAGGTSIIERR